jgi:hypothetical protein
VVGEFAGSISGLMHTVGHRYVRYLSTVSSAMWRWRLWRGIFIVSAEFFKKTGVFWQVLITFCCSFECFLKFLTLMSLNAMKFASALC